MLPDTPKCLLEQGGRAGGASQIFLYYLDPFQPDFWLCLRRKTALVASVEDFCLDTEGRIRPVAMGGGADRGCPTVKCPHLSIAPGPPQSP